MSDWEDVAYGPAANVQSASGSGDWEDVGFGPPSATVSTSATTVQAQEPGIVSRLWSGLKESPLLSPIQTAKAAGQAVMDFPENLSRTVEWAQEDPAAFGDAATNVLGRGAASTLGGIAGTVAGPAGIAAGATAGDYLYGKARQVLGLDDVTGLREDAGNVAESFGSNLGFAAVPKVVEGGARAAKLPVDFVKQFTPSGKEAAARSTAEEIIRNNVDIPKAQQALALYREKVAQASPTEVKSDQFLPKYQRTAEITQDSGIASLEESLRRTGNIEPIVQAQDAAREAARQKIYGKAIPEELTPEAAGANIREGLTANLERSQEKVNKLAERAFQGGEELRTFPAKMVVSDALNEFTANGARQVTPEFQRLVDNFRSLPPRVDLQTLQDYRSAFGKFSGSGGIGTSPVEKMTAEIAGRMRAAVDNSVAKAAEGGELPKAQANAWRQMIDTRRKQGQTYESGIVGKILKEEPYGAGFKIDASEVAKKALSTPEDARALMDALGPHIPGKTALRSALLQDVWERSTNSLTKEFNPTAFSKQLRLISGVDSEVLTKPQLKVLERIGKDLESQSTVKRLAFSASKGNSVTSQASTAIDLLQQSMQRGGSSALDKFAPKLSRVIKVLKDVVSNPEQHRMLVNRELAEFVLNPGHAESFLASAQSRAGVQQLDAFASHLRRRLPMLLSTNAEYNQSDSDREDSRLSASEGARGSFLMTLRPNTSDSALEYQRGQNSQQGVPTATIERGRIPASQRVSPPTTQTWQQGTNGNLGAGPSVSPLSQQSNSPTKPKGNQYVNAIVDALVPPAEASTGEAASPITNELVKAIIHVESRGNPKAVSPAGAKGVMQLMPEMAKALGVSDPLDPAQNIQGGVKLLEEEMGRYKGDIALALAAYNAGSPKVNAAIRKAGTTDFDAVAQYLPSETKKYVPNVLKMVEALSS